MQKQAFYSITMNIIYLPDWVIDNACIRVSQGKAYIENISYKLASQVN